MISANESYKTFNHRPMDFCVIIQPPMTWVPGLSSPQGVFFVLSVRAGSAFSEHHWIFADRQSCVAKLGGNKCASLCII